MHLQDQPRLQTLGAQAIRDVDHRQLDDVGSRTLDRHVQRHALAEGTHVEVAAFQLRKIAAPSVERADVAVRFCLLHNALHIVAYAVVFFEIGLHVFLRFVWADVDILCKREGGNAVNDAEIDRLGTASQRGRDLGKRHVEDL